MEEALIFFNMYLETYTLFLFLFLDKFFFLTYLSSSTCLDNIHTHHSMHHGQHEAVADIVWTVALQRVGKIKNEIN